MEDLEDFSKIYQKAVAMDKQVPDDDEGSQQKDGGDIEKGHKEDPILTPNILKNMYQTIKTSFKPITKSNITPWIQKNQQEKKAK